MVQHDESDISNVGRVRDLQPRMPALRARPLLANGVGVMASSERHDESMHDVSRSRKLNIIAQRGFSSESQCEGSFTFLGWTCAQVSTNQCAATNAPGPEYSSDRAGACASELGNLACDASFTFEATAACPSACCFDSGGYPPDGDASKCCSGQTHEIEVTGCGPSTISETICD